MMEIRTDEEGREILYDEGAEQLEAAHRRTKRRRKWIIAGIVLVFLLVGGWWMLGTMWNYTAHSQMQTRIAKAHRFAEFTEQWQENGEEIGSGIYCARMTRRTKFEDDLQGYFEADTEGDWFGLVMDDSGEIVYTMYSEKQIPEEYLQSPPDFEEQYALLRSHFFFKKRRTIAVWYADDSKNTMRD